jgi:hypothetical protein
VSKPQFNSNTDHLQAQGTKVHLVSLNNPVQAAVTPKGRPKKAVGRKRQQTNNQPMITPKSATLISATTLQPVQIPQTQKKLTIKKIEATGIYFKPIVLESTLNETEFRYCG